MTTQYWLVKQEPESYSWEDFVRDRSTAWEGVRNYQARNNLRAMRRGDPVLFYASGDVRAVVGTSTVGREAYPDPTADEEGWVAVDLKAGSPLPMPVTLASIKADAALKNIALVRNSRLSVIPLKPTEYERIVAMGSA